MPSWIDVADGLALANLGGLAKRPSELAEEKGVVFINDAAVARFGKRRDTEFSFGDREEQVTLAHEVVETEYFGSRSETADGVSTANCKALARWPGDLTQDEHIGSANAAAEICFGGRFDFGYSFGDVEEQVVFPQDLTETEDVGSRNGTAEGVPNINLNYLSRWPSDFVVEDEKEGCADDAVVTRCGGRFDTEFSFADPEEQPPVPRDFALKESVESRSDGAHMRVTGKSGGRLYVGDLETQLSKAIDPVDKARVEARDDAIVVAGGAGMDLQFSFSSLVEQAVWPSELVGTERAACVPGNLLGSLMCGSGARAAWKFRQRVAEDNGSSTSISLPSRAPSTKPQPRTNAENNDERLDAQRLRSVKPEPRARPGAGGSSTSSATMDSDQVRRRSVKPTPRKRPGGNNQGIEAADPVCRAQEEPTGDVAFDPEAADSRRGTRAELCMTEESFGCRSTFGTVQRPW
eukprot:TRINITY_DN13617_c1_g6_i1.p1 TRINITY_DN13617_c1_g6~~TRINITY_DN13617_c1_g6_i1.p1  ORF type:complete len:464 (-),score=59.79 TRINITY_DN13617_c1_g6_i1:460-1851(-)